MKLFSLIATQEVCTAPGMKVIPAKDFSTLQKASQVLKTARQEAKDLAEKGLREAQEERERGFQEGFQKGMESFHVHLLALDQELKELRIEIQKKILPLTLSTARKILGEELRLHPDRIVDIILTSLKPVSQHKKITIYVNREDLEFLEKEKPKIKAMFEHLQSLSLQVRDDIEQGGCIIETEAGIINAQLENQWRALESAFQSFKSS